MPQQQDASVADFLQLEAVCAAAAADCGVQVSYPVTALMPLKGCVSDAELPELHREES